MGGPGSGRKPEDTCRAGLHDLTDPDNVQIIRRKRDDGSTYTERECRPCQNKRQRDRWRRKHGKGK